MNTEIVNVWPTKLIILADNTRELSGIRYDVSEAFAGAQLWLDNSFTVSNLPEYLIGTTLLQIPYKTASPRANIQVLVSKPSNIYIAYEDGRRGRYGNSLREQGWSLITSDSEISTGCCGLNFIWRKYVLEEGLTTVDLPRLTKNGFVFTLFVQDNSNFIPKLQGATYELQAAFDGAQVWFDASFTFSYLPKFLSGTIFFQLEYQSLTKASALDVLVYQPSYVYIAYEKVSDDLDTRTGQFEINLQEEGWKLITYEGGIGTGCCTLHYIWRKHVISDGGQTVEIPRFPQDNFVIIIFVQSHIGELKSDVTDIAISTDYDPEDSIISKEIYNANRESDEESEYELDELECDVTDIETQSGEAFDDAGEKSSPSFNEVASAGERCIEKIEMAAQTEYDDKLVCKHSYAEECHQSYVTDYKPQQQQECEETFRKQCFISHEEQASQEKVQVCNTPLICDSKGKEVCQIAHETRCETRNHVHDVIDDVVNCQTVFETDCKNVTTGYTSTEECRKWPKVQCDVEQMDSKRITPISECFKVPKEVCGEKGCNLIPGSEVCYDETQTVIQQVNKHGCRKL